MAEVELALNRPAAAAAAFQAALDLEPDNIEALENLAILSVRSGQYDLARRYIGPLLSLSANDPAGLLASGAIDMGERRFDDAYAMADRIIAVLPDRADGYVLKARALDALGKTQDAIRLLEKRVIVADDDKDLLVQLMAIYRRIGDLQAIRATAIRLMPLFPDDPRYAFESARAYASRGDQQEVHTIIDGLLQRFGHDTNVMLAIGAFWRDTQPLPVARAEITKLATVATARVRTALADQLIDMGDPHDALALLASLAPAEVTAGNVDSQTHYARALLETGQVASAQAKVDAVLDYDDSNPEALLTRALIKLRARDYRGAITDAQRVTSDDDQNEEAALLVPAIYVAQGNQVLAAGAYGTARQQFPDSTNALKAETDWLIGQKRNQEAGQRAASFFRTHPKSGPAAHIYRDVCARTQGAGCGVGTSNVAKMLAG
jgi:tetratricopeptide (TPR) repeat protein